MDPLSLGAAGVGAIGSLFGGGKGDNGGGDRVITPPRPDMSGSMEPQLQAASQAQMAAFAPFSQYGAGYQLMPQQMLGQVYVPGPNPTIMGDPYNPQGYDNFFGASARPQAAAQTNVADTGGAGKGMGVPSAMAQQPQGIGGSPALNALFQIGQTSSGMVNNRPSNQGGA